MPDFRLPEKITNNLDPAWNAIMDGVGAPERGLELSILGPEARFHGGHARHGGHIVGLLQNALACLVGEEFDQKPRRIGMRRVFENPDRIACGRAPAPG